jgi:hypothetical protein
MLSQVTHHSGDLSVFDAEQLNLTQGISQNSRISKLCCLIPSRLLKRAADWAA